MSSVDHNNSSSNSSSSRDSGYNTTNCNNSNSNSNVVLAHPQAIAIFRTACRAGHLKLMEQVLFNLKFLLLNIQHSILQVCIYSSAYTNSLAISTIVLFVMIDAVSLLLQLVAAIWCVHKLKSNTVTS
jgi:hypothetical protein